MRSNTIEQRDEELSALRRKLNLAEQKNSQLSQKCDEKTQELALLAERLREEELRFVEKENLSAIKIKALEEKFERLERNLEIQMTKVKKRLETAFESDKALFENQIKSHYEQSREKIANTLFAFLLQKSKTIQDKDKFFKAAVQEFFDKIYPKIDFSPDILRAENISEADVNHLYSFDLDQIK